MAVALAGLAILGMVVENQLDDVAPRLADPSFGVAIAATYLSGFLAALATEPIPTTVELESPGGTLADALELRDWRIYHALAQRLIVRARALYAQDVRARAL